MPTVLKGNKREVPPGVPPLTWYHAVMAAEAEGLDIPWWHPVMELLSPAELRRVRAKAVVWRRHTGAWPQDLSCWWETRMARRRGDITEPTALVVAREREDGIVLCGHCGARWAPPVEASGCKLCGSLWTRREKVAC